MSEQNSTSKECDTSILPPADPCVLVIFGISGDLTKRLLFPSICNLGSNGLLNENFYIVGVDKVELSNDAFRTQLKKDIEQFNLPPI